MNDPGFHKAVAHKLLMAISGVDGAGKTSLIGALQPILRSRGIRARRASFGELRSWTLLELLGRKGEPYARHAFNADRMSVALNLERLQILLDTVVPQFEICDVVLLDRFVIDWAATGRAFGAGGHEIDLMKAISGFVRIPVRHYYLEVSAELADSRIKRRGENGESREGLSYLKKAVLAYEEVIGLLKCDVCRLDGAASTEAIVEHVLFDLSFLHPQLNVR